MSHKIAIAIPAGTPWPVKGRNPDTGELILAKGFLEAVADASGLSLPWHGDQSKPRLTNDMVSDLLIRWYNERLALGEPRCPIMDELIKEALLEKPEGQS
jgi:hypothetical protein